jgi:hypothetical protein
MPMDEPPISLDFFFPPYRIEHQRHFMKMRTIIAVVAMSLLVSPATAQQEVSLVGTWSGERDRSAKVEGYRSGTATLVITEQKGRAFKGYLLRSNADGDVKEDLWGAFTPGARLMAGADDEGVYSFMLVDVNTLDYCYVEAGKAPRAVCARLVRKR